MEIMGGLAIGGECLFLLSENEKTQCHETYLLLCLVLARSVRGTGTTEHYLYHDRPADRYGDELCRKRRRAYTEYGPPCQPGRAFLECVLQYALERPVPLLHVYGIYARSGRLDRERDTDAGFDTA